MKTQGKVVNAGVRIFTDGSGSRPDGKGSGFAWFRQDTGQKKIVREDGLTNNQAEYRAILAAVETLPTGAKAEILTDSENTCFQLKGIRRVIDPHLADLNARINSLIAKRRLAIEFTWIPRRENLAGKLI
jgi:ribonuclease HI